MSQSALEPKAVKGRLSSKFTTKSQ